MARHPDELRVKIGTIEITASGMAATRIAAAVASFILTVAAYLML
jgi:hypothetical protein